ncbi:TRAP transporter small permease [Paracoccus yeei]|nr:TRAP transporter small permease [Paracoccus yeei]
MVPTEQIGSRTRRTLLLHRVSAASSLISRLALGLAALVLVAMVLHVLVEIVLRSVFASSTFVLEEFLGYGVAAATFLTLGSALAEGSLIRVSLVQDRLDIRARRISEVFSIVCALAVAGFVGWFIFLKTIRDFGRGTVSATIAQVPVWIPEAIALGGLVILTIQLVTRLIVVALAEEACVSTLFAHAVHPEDEIG